MADAMYDWNKQVNNSKHEAESLTYDISTVENALNQLVTTITDLADAAFNDEQDYTIRQASQQLWSSVSSGVSTTRAQIDAARISLNDLRRVVDFYSRY